MGPHSATPQGGALILGFKRLNPTPSGFTLNLTPCDVIRVPMFKNNRTPGDLTWVLMLENNITLGDLTGVPMLENNIIPMQSDLPPSSKVIKY